jgi:hypothetical protein
MSLSDRPQFREALWHEILNHGVEETLETIVEFCEEIQAAGRTVALEHEDNETMVFECAALSGYFGSRGTPLKRFLRAQKRIDRPAFEEADGPDDSPRLFLVYPGRRSAV